MKKSEASWKGEYKRMVVLYIITLILLLAITTLLIREGNIEHKEKEAAMELAVASLEIAQICAEHNNMTYTEITDLWLDKKFEELRHEFPS